MRNRIIATLTLSVIFIPQSYADSPLLHQNAPGLDRTTPEMQKLNAEFRSVYTDAKAEMEHSSSPVIVVGAGVVTLVHKDEKQQFAYRPANYSVLKVVDHIPVAIFSLLINHTDSPLEAGHIKHLQILKERTETVAPQLDAADLPLEILQRQKTIIVESIKFIDSVLAANLVKDKDLMEFTRHIGGLTLDNGYDAASIELAGLDRVVQKWKTEMTPDEWNKLHVVVSDAHMPRKQERAMQYFSKLLNEDEEGHRIIYMEGSDRGLEGAMDLLMTHELDGQMANYFYADENRMHRDFLSDGAKKYLDEHPPVALTGK